MKRATELPSTRVARRAFVRRRVWALLPRKAGGRNARFGRAVYEASRAQAVAEWYRRAA